MKQWPQTIVLVTGPNERILRMPSARYHETLVRLGELGTLRQTAERTSDLRAALAAAHDERTRAALERRLAFARIDVRLESLAGS
jgi:hypothetical protein